MAEGCDVGYEAAAAVTMHPAGPGGPAGPAVVTSVSEPSGRLCGGGAALLSCLAGRTKA